MSYQPNAVLVRRPLYRQGTSQYNDIGRRFGNKVLSTPFVQHCYHQAARKLLTGLLIMLRTKQEVVTHSGCKMEGEDVPVQKMRPGWKGKLHTLDHEFSLPFARAGMRPHALSTLFLALCRFPFLPTFFAYLNVRERTSLLEPDVAFDRSSKHTLHANFPDLRLSAKSVC